MRDHPDVLSMKWGGLVSLHTLVHRAIAPGFRPRRSTRCWRRRRAHDVIVAHHFAFPAPVAAELAGLPWATVSLAPGVVPSAYTLPGANFGRAGEGAVGRASATASSGRRARLITRSMVDPVVNRFRAKHGLRPVRDAVFEAHSPRLNLQLYSEHFAPRPPDWSAEKTAWPDSAFTIRPAPRSRRRSRPFSRGEPPVLFTLGSTAVQNPGDFYESAVEALPALAFAASCSSARRKTGPRDLPDGRPRRALRALRPAHAARARGGAPVRHRHAVARAARRACRRSRARLRSTSRTTRVGSRRSALRKSYCRTSTTREHIGARAATTPGRRSRHARAKHRRTHPRRGWRRAGMRRFWRRVFGRRRS